MVFWHHNPQDYNLNVKSHTCTIITILHYTLTHTNLKVLCHVHSDFRILCYSFTTKIKRPHAQIYSTEEKVIIQGVCVCFANVC